MSQTTLQKHISRLMALLLCALMLLPCVPVARAEEGACGSSLTWSFDGSTLTISGSGSMSNYTESSPAPWYSYRDSITRISLPEGLTRIGSRAFAHCTALASVTIPGSVEVIGEAAFLNCSSMTMVTFNEGLLTIGVCAFEQCSSLGDIRLPNSLMYIDDHAFYLCKALTYVTIPGAVRNVGSGVFAYCSGLIRADINADVTMPGWSFFGCDNLQVVTIQGTSVAPETLMVSNPPQGIPGYTPSEEDDESYAPPAPTQPVSPAEPAAPSADGTASGESTKTDASGATVTEKTVVTKNDDSVVTTTTQTPASGSSSTQINSTVQNENGWQDVLDSVGTALLNKTGESVDVTVMTPNSNTVSKEVLQEFAGKDVNLNIHTQSGTQVRLDCSRMDDEIKEDLDLSYTITLAEDVPESMAGCVVYSLKFHTSAEFDMEIIMRLPGDHRLQTASLYERKKQKNPALLQSVLVDDNSNAHFYLAAVDEKTDYLIGINVPGTNISEAIIPDAMYDEYRLVDHSTGKEYVITGRKSSWNMGLGKVMAILAVVMVSAIGVIGFVMYFWNKQRLKNGYVPQWEDDEET